jgi:mono/diheme cytochrome c family protein
MRQSAWIGLLLLAVSQQAASAGEPVLNEQQALGRRLYEQSCGVCHTRPTLVAGMYGPELNKTSGNGQEEIVRGVITEGTPRMPAFKYTYDDKQIAAVAAYVMTLEPGHQTVTPPQRPQPH